ncbi:MAG TPA: dienelactone hydrolase family protein [Chthonomonadaceae bacterium]|nr:dienelactone hydrolase family protein [Chthonomonadaceae bacterium]
MEEPLPGTEPLTLQGDLAAQMVAGIDRFLMREIDRCADRREARWQRDLASPEAYARSIEPNRARFRKMLGVVDAREPAAMRMEAPVLESGRPEAAAGAGASYKVYAVRWSVLRGVEGEGLLLQPDRAPLADVVALPDCDQTPEMLVGMAPGVPLESQFARRLAENGCRVLVPVLIDRRDTYSGILEVHLTNQPHREFLYRAAYEMGRHILGYEVQKVLAAVDWFATRRAAASQSPISSIGVIGYGEGGLIAFYAAAIDPRIDAAAVCGYFQPREPLWREPIYRNVFGMLAEFGDAEIAGLIAPRALVIEACRHPEVAGPPSPSPGHSDTAAPGVLTTPPLAAVESEYVRACHLVEGLHPVAPFTLVKSGHGDGPPGTDATLSAFLSALGSPRPLAAPGRPPKSVRPGFDAEARRKRQIDQIAGHIEYLIRESPYRREAFWSKADATSADTWQASCRWYRDYFWDEIVGRLPSPTLTLNPRSRLVYETPKLHGYEVVLDVYPDVFAYGTLLVPKDIRPGEQRAVVVCQHGLEGRSQDVADPDVNDPGYHQFAVKLAEQGFVTYAPQNPYIGEDRFRVLLRKAQPLHLTLFSFIVRQHERTLDWLTTLPFVDPQRIGFYGISYGGKTAMRVPALLDRYCLSICSANYNEWIWKNASMRSPYSYLLLPEYDMMEFDLGNTFNYAEMSGLIFPRPFMVERGHDDGVAPDEWVAYEFAKTRRRYDLLGLGDRTEIEFFNGPHAIHGVGTFQFLHRHLNGN